MMKYLWLAALPLSAGSLHAQEGIAARTGAPADTVAPFVLEPLVVEGRVDDLTGIAVSASHGYVGFRDIRLRPMQREGELLETVPGLIMTQHSGDGKSNQMFARGFNLDHGTDFLTVVEGMPVNIPTHAHGQGYTDLNFIIPELVDHVEYRMGSYQADAGDFSAAGSAQIRLRRALEGPLVSVGWGEGGFRRLVAAGSGRAGGGDLLGGLEGKRYAGPWEIGQDLRKLSGMARLSRSAGRHHFSLLGMGYDNRWNASDQVPLRLVEVGAIGRFGQVDPMLGGSSSRYSLSGSWMRAGPASSQRLDMYGILYDLDLYSNFTYLLEDPEAGDQIQQRDDGRRTLGGGFAHVQPLGAHELTAGIQARLDLADVALRRTRARRLIEPIREDEVTQLGSGVYLEARSSWGGGMRSLVGLRADHHAFEVASDLAANSGTTSAGILSPRGSLSYAPSAGVEAYLSGGFGYHSNDGRGTVQTVDPATGEEVNPVDPLVRSRSAEAGLRLNPAQGWRSTVALWSVDLDSELLFVGDAGTTEPSDATRRRGVTWTNFFRVGPSLTADLDVSLARARFAGAPDGNDRIPGAMERVVTGAVAWEPVAAGPFVALRLRHFGAYPLVEDDSRRAPASTLLNLNLGWAAARDLRVGVGVLNLLDARASDIEYFYPSRVRGEPLEGVEDVHFHPVEPQLLRLTATWGF